jgi:hypothetical protein
MGEWEVNYDTSNAISEISQVRKCDKACKFGSSHLRCVRQIRGFAQQSPLLVCLMRLMQVLVLQLKWLKSSQNRERTTAVNDS